jgi:serine O-acetyltransferase
MVGDSIASLVHACRSDLGRLDAGSDWLSFVKCYFSNRGFRAVVYYRVARYLTLKRIRYVPALIKARCLSITGAEIACEARIGLGLLITHPVGVVVGSRVIIGDNCTIMQGVNLGEKWSDRNEKQVPIIGNDVILGTGSKVLGGVEIGDRVMVGANSVVIDSIPPDRVVAGVPARILRSF